MVVLNISLNVTQRIQFVRDLFNQNITYNNSYGLTTVQMILNPTQTGVNASGKE
jgi:hypothetical protein